MIRVVAHVTGGSDARATAIEIELGERDAPDAVPHLVAALRAEIERRRVGVAVAVDRAEAPPALPEAAPVEAPKPDA